jgi:hypothetical protein
MLFISLVSLLLGTAWAQTPAGFTPEVTAKLDVIFSSASVTPGLALSKAGELEWF